MPYPDPSTREYVVIRAKEIYPNISDEDIELLWQWRQILLLDHGYDISTPHVKKFIQSLSGKYFKSQ